MTRSSQSAQAPPPRAARGEEQTSSTQQLSELLGTMGPIVGLFLVFALFAILRPKTFLAMDNLQIILLNTAVYGTAALGATVIIISGGIDLSVGANIAMCTVVIALCRAHGMPSLAAAVMGIAASASIGLVIGVLVTQLRLPSFIVTLGLWGAVRGFAKWLAGGEEIPTSSSWISQLLQMLQPGQHWMIVPSGVWLLIVLTLFVAGVLRFTRFGRHVFAIGSNEQTARLCGIPVARTKLFIFIFATFFAGVAGLLQFSYLNNLGDPTTANGYELNIIAAVVIGGASLSGGKGSVFGSMVGALLMTAVANGCNKINLSNAVQEMVTGGIIVAAAAFDQFRQPQATAK
ncbi:MAG: ABC transporter permease [Tepidisphaeraceae bacterium]|jgi:ribose/xylose/arabinose/galactoside ABC-type transport system permease subunit